MGEITPELQALADAALGLQRMIKASHGVLDCPAVASAIEDHAGAAEAYRASIAPKECRPPNGAKHGSLWWLVRRTGEREPWKWSEGGWLEHGDQGSASCQFMGADGWTVHSPCVFPGDSVCKESLHTGGDQVEATDDAFALLAATYPDLRPVSYGTVIDYTKAALARFSPKVRELSDAKISAIALNHEWQTIAEAEYGHTVRFVRACIAYVLGQE